MESVTNDYGIFGTAVALIMAAVSVYQLFKGEIFKSFSLMPILHGQKLLSGVTMVLCLCGLLLAVFWERLGAETGGSLMSYAWWCMGFGLGAMAIFTVLSLIFVRSYQWRVETEYKRLAGGPVLKAQFVQLRGPMTDTPDKYLQMGNYEPNNVWAWFWRLPVVVMIVVSSIVMQVGLVVGITMTAMLLSTPRETVEETTAVQLRSIPIQTLFEPDSTILIPPSPDQVAEDVEQIEAFDPMLIYVRGHTDSTVGAIDNQELSEKRAGAVADWLGVVLAEAFGEDVPKIEAIGLADTCPRVPVDQLSGALKDSAHAHNRRVELLLVKDAGQVDPAQCDAVKRAESDAAV